MMDSNIVMVVGELEIEDDSVMVETSETGTVVYKNASCQVDFSSQNARSVPIVFCGLQLSSCEASTQCDIPLIVSCSEVDVAVSARRPLDEIGKEQNRVTASIQNVMDSEFQTDIIKDTIEEVILTNAVVEDFDSFQKDNHNNEELADVAQKGSISCPPFSVLCSLKLYQYMVPI